MKPLYSLLFVISCVDTANVLVYSPRIGRSHVKFMGNIADVLSDAGHNVTVLSTFLDPHVNIHGITKKATVVDFKSPYLGDQWLEMGFKNSEFWYNAPGGTSLEIQDLHVLYSSQLDGCKGIVENDDLIRQMRNTNFDLAISEVYDYCPTVVFELFGIKKVIYTSALGFTHNIYELTGIPHKASYIPHWITTFDDRPTLWQRVETLYIRFKVHRIWSAWKDKMQAYVRTVHPDFPDITELARKRMGAVFLNTNLFTETPRPTAQVVRYIGGSTIYDGKNVDEEYDGLLSLRPRNVIFSLGSLINSCEVPKHILQEIIHAFGTFPDVTFIWKYEEPERDASLFANYSNIIPRKWIPQKELLNDPRLTAFITHAGMNSILESLFAGKPLISIPIFADQMVNAKNAVNQGLSVMIPRNQITRENLVKALRKVMEDGHETITMSDNSKRVATILKGKNERMRDEIVEWADIVIRHGTLPSLVLQGREMSLIEYFNLDIIIPALSLPFIILVSIWHISRRLSLSVVNRDALTIFKKKQ